MFIYSTCSDCGGLLHVTDIYQSGVHPGCRSRRTKIDRLCQEWLTAVESLDTVREQELQAAIDEHDAKPPRLAEAAIAYARWDWPVFPLKPRSKQPATRHGFKDATTDTTRIAAWWNRHPDSNIGLPTGIAFDVVDVDVPVGIDFHNQLLADELLPDVHGHVVTANGGIHYYVPATGDGNRAGVMPGIDYRGAGGYVVAPPSTLGERWRSWSWLVKPSPQLTAVCGRTRRRAA